MIPWLTECLLLLVAGALALGLPIDHTSSQIPEEFLIRLQSVQNISQFLERWVNQAALQRAYLLHGEDDGPEVELAQPAGCLPELQTVELHRGAYDPSLVVWPICTRVRRCGGCCSSKLLHCVPTRTTMITVKVVKARYPHAGAEMLDLEGYENVRLEQHDRCACQCRQQARDCGTQQRYMPGQCRCVCHNDREAARCNTADRYWDIKSCFCKCRRETDCSTGSFFSAQSCKCEALNPQTSISDHIVGPAPHLRALIRDDGGENDAYRLRYAALDSPEHVGPFAMTPFQQAPLLLDNGTQTHWTED